MKIVNYLFLALFIVSCTSDDSEASDIDNTNLLSTAISGSLFETSAVIACAASDSLNTAVVKVYFFPEEDATDFKLYETDFIDLDPNDFSNYKSVDINDTPLFDGTLRQYSRDSEIEKWFIVTYELENEIKISNPIRGKNEMQPTIASSDVVVNQDQSLMPIFSWNSNFEANNAIFFQVVTAANGTFLSGTYTFDTQFQYYNTSNVVLNITEGTPPTLIPGADYNFTLMDVSVDNWVNEINIIGFTAE